MSPGTLGLALLSGLLSVLSPCVLPLVPIVFGSAAGEARGGPVALAAGVALSFTAIGLFVATLGFAIGLDGEAFRMAAAILMIGVGVVLMAPGPTNESTPFPRAGFSDNSASAFCLAPRGAPASGRRSARPRFWRRKAPRSVASR
jgi:cytochrome c biogenesis protein CcdA